MLGKYYTDARDAMMCVSMYTHNKPAERGWKQWQLSST